MGDIPPEVLEEATQILLFLESIDWKWDINTVKAQDDETFRVVMLLKVTASKLEKQEERRKRQAQNG